MTELVLRDLHQHAYLLSRFFAFSCYERDYSWRHVAEWLNLAAGVITFDFDSARYDMSVMLCSGAARYEAEKSDLLTRFLLN
jgi:hypothetical protein